MGRKLSESEFLERVPKIIKQDFKIGAYKGIKSKITLLHNESGLLYKSNPEYLIRGNYPSIKSVYNREKYFRYKINKLHPEYELINVPTKFKEKVLLKDVYGINYFISVGSLIEGRKPNINSAVCKNKYFITKSNLIHNNKYDYTKSKYTSATNNIVISCPKHGDFEQKAISHLRGAGCNKCVKRPGGYKLKDWVKYAENSNNFESYKLYTIKIYNDEESFYKIGRTFLPINKRFYKNTSSSMPYNYDIVSIVSGTAKYIYNLEIIKHRELKKYKYKPMKHFDGVTECFTQYKK